jgi:HD-GYP domain-containing protein (c-di-GMP phosphodiesterase class II)
VRLTTVERAVGLPLARDLPTMAGGLPLLARGAVITERYRQVLDEHGIRSVWVDDELSAGIEPAELLPEPERADAVARVRRARDAARSAFATSRTLPAQTLHDLAEVVGALTWRARECADACLVLHDLGPAERYPDRHPVNAAALGLFLARALFTRHGWVDYSGRREFERIDERLELLGLGLLLQDIGTVAVPADVLLKPGPLDDRERALVRAHPDAGVALLPARSISPRVVGVVADHHERLDGSGYPRGIAGDELHQFATVAAVADVYAAATSERPWRRAATPHAGVGIIADGAGTAFDAEVVEVFRRLALPYPPGIEIELADGQVGVVAEVEPAHPAAPVVRFAGAAGPVQRPVDMRAERVT